MKSFQAREVFCIFALQKFIIQNILNHTDNDENSL